MQISQTLFRHLTDRHLVHDACGTCNQTDVIFFWVTRTDSEDPNYDTRIFPIFTIRPTEKANSHSKALNTQKLLYVVR